MHSRNICVITGRQTGCQGNTAQGQFLRMMCRAAAQARK